MPPSFAFLRGSRADVARLFGTGADARLVEPPLPFVPIDHLDTPNADHLGCLFFNVSNTVGDEDHGSVGSAFFASCREVYEGGDGCLVLLELPQRFVEAVGNLEDHEVPWAAASVSTLRVAEKVPEDPFTKRPRWTEEIYRARLREVHECLVAEISSFRAFFMTARAAGERVWVWADLR